MGLEYCIIPEEVEIINATSWLLGSIQKGSVCSGIQVVWVDSPLFWILILHYSVQMEQPRALEMQEAWGDVCIWDEECTPGHGGDGY